MSEVMVRNSTRQEIEHNFEDYDLEHSHWAIKRLLELHAKDADNEEILRREINSLECSLEEFESTNGNLSEENDELRERIKELKQNATD